jgi:membrane associated rhomboid family serine protease
MSVTHTPPRFRELPPVTQTLLLLNFLGYLAMAWAGPVLLNTVALIPERVTGRFWLWQLLTYCFFHEGFFHLFFNLFALWMFGREIERRMGSRAFLSYYLVTALGASLTQVAITPHSTIPSLGASGAIYGILAAFAALFPEAVVYLYFLIPLTAKQLVLLFAGLEFLSGFSNAGSKVANFAHLGGLLTGWLYFKLPGITESLRFKAREAFSRSKKSSFKLFSGEAEQARRSREGAKADLSQQVDRILEKVLREGAQSLTSEEEKIMKTYSQKRRTPGA